MAKEDEIRLIAFNIWEQEGCIHGKDCDHWFRAEAIWEEQQKPKAPVKTTKTQPKVVAKGKTSARHIRKKKA
jgi:hypothetical protein